MTDKLISDEARDLIVAEEVSSEQAYKARYQHPEWPGGSSGLTIGIGYDVGAGVHARDQLWGDWKGHIPDDMIRAMEPAIGVTGGAANGLVQRLHNKITVPWDAAIAVFDDVDVPRWYRICKQHLPNFETLSPDCRGALVSLAYNRGASFEKDGERYAEMRAIRVHMSNSDFARIPGDFRSMKRLWPNKSMRGLVLRREHEARLFERGRASQGAAAA